MKMQSAGLWISYLSATSMAAAFTLQTSDPLQEGWSGRPVRFYINRENCPSNVDTLINNALSVWNGVTTSSLKVELGDDSTNTVTDLLNGDAQNLPLIVCDTNFSTDLSVDGDSIPGVGLVAGSSYRPISYGGLILNVESGVNANLSNLSETLASVVVAHEIGHVLGIGHSADTNSLMYYDATAKAHLALSQDDVDAVSFLYPRNEVQHLNMIGGCGALRSSSRGSPWGGNSLLLLVCAYFLSRGLRLLKRRSPILNLENLS